MRHGKKRMQLGRFTSWHDATIVSLAKNMVINQSIKTTLIRAKSCKQEVEKLITLAKKNTLFARRQAQKVLGEHRLVNVLFNEIGPRFAKRNSGFTRIISLGRRRGDNAEMAILELTELKKKEVKKPKHVKEAKPEIEEVEATEVKETNEVKEIKVDAKEKPFDEKKPQKKFMGGLRTIFKKKSDSL
ncbi:MAG: 50S ribosomal protein L17 [Candidatus Omnitrophota bacterium]